MVPLPCFGNPRNSTMPPRNENRDHATLCTNIPLMHRFFTPRPTVPIICPPPAPSLPSPLSPTSDNARHLWRRIDSTLRDAPTAEAEQLQQAWTVGKLLWER